MPKSPVTQRLPELAESKSLLETLNEEVAKTRKTLARTRIFRLATAFSRLLWEPQLQKAIFDGTVKTVVVWKLDRLSRRQHEGIGLLATWCEQGVRVVSVTQQIDLNGAVGRMLASVMFGLAEIEQEYRRERQTAGIAVAKRKGVYQGRVKGTTKAQPDRAQRLRDRGLTAPEIATALGVHPRTIFRYLAEGHA